MRARACARACATKTVRPSGSIDKLPVGSALIGSTLHTRIENLYTKPTLYIRISHIQAMCVYNACIIRFLPIYQMLSHTHKHAA